eukprot:m51a1_g13407 hypothetical protein (207) ;mRNA; f:54311-65805
MPNEIVATIIERTCSQHHHLWAKLESHHFLEKVVWCAIYKDLKGSRSHPYVVCKVKHLGKVHVWGCFSTEGFECLYTFTCNLNSKKLCHIYNKALLPSAKKMFGPVPGGWVLQEDNNPKHTSKLAKAWRASHNVDRMAWPACSPDLNPIENEEYQEEQQDDQDDINWNDMTTLASMGPADWIWFETVITTEATKDVYCQKIESCSD